MLLASADTVQAIERELRAGTPRRQIARRLNVSRWLVDQVRSRRHVSQQEPTHVRCPDCGAMVRLPCLRCSLQLAAA